MLLSGSNDDARHAAYVQNMQAMPLQLDRISVGSDKRKRGNMKLNKCKCGAEAETHRSGRTATVYCDNMCCVRMIDMPTKAEASLAWNLVNPAPKKRKAKRV